MNLLRGPLQSAQFIRFGIQERIILVIKATDFWANIKIHSIIMNIASLAIIFLVVALSMGRNGVNAIRTQQRLNLLRRFHKTKMQIKKVKPIEHSAMDARMMPRFRYIEAKNVPIKSDKKISSLNLRTLQSDVEVTKLLVQIKTLFKERQRSRNKLFYWNNCLRMYKNKYSEKIFRTYFITFTE